MVEQTDNDLVQNCLKGDANAFAVLVERYQKAIFNTTYRMIRDWDEAEEMTQRTFVKAYEKLDKFNPRYKFFSWLYRIAINETLNHLNSRKRIETLPAEMTTREKNPEELYNDVELNETLLSALEGIEPGLQILIVLKHFQGFSYQEISGFLGIPEKTVKSRLYTARQLLKESLLKMGFAP